MEKQRACNLDNWKALKNQPEPVKGLRKIKARNMVKAMQEGEHVSGNNRCVYTTDKFSFYYRGTLIYEWYPHLQAFMLVDAGPYEQTMATQNQRREIITAIENFCEVYNI